MTIATPMPSGPQRAEGASQPQDDAPVTMLNPDFPFSYDEFLSHPAGLGSVPEHRHGTGLPWSAPASPVLSRRTSS